METRSRSLSSSNDFLQHIDTNGIMHKVPGLAVSFVSGASQTAETHVRGLANCELRLPVSENTVFRIGSISKTITTILILKLWEEGKIPSLDTPVVTLLRSIRLSGKYASHLSLRHLLTHTGGLETFRSVHEFFSDTQGLGSPADSAVPSTATFYGPGGVRVQRRPGRSWMYSNHGFALLGQIIEDVSGCRLDEFAQKKLFEPLGMKSSSYSRDFGLIAQNLAVGYEAEEQPSDAVRFRPVLDREIIPKGAGSVFSSINDLSLYLRMLLSGGSNILSKATMDQMFRLQFSASERLSGIGLGFGIDPEFRLSAQHAPTLMAAHTGAWPGFSSSVFIFPHLGVGFAVCTNIMDPTTVARVCRPILHSFLPRLSRILVPRSVRIASTDWIRGTYVLHDSPKLKKMEILMNQGPILRVKVSKTSPPDPTLQISLSSLWGSFSNACVTSIFEIAEADGSSVIVFFDSTNDQSLPLRVEFRRKGPKPTLFLGMDVFRQL